MKTPGLHMTGFDVQLLGTKSVVTLSPYKQHTSINEDTPDAAELQKMRVPFWYVPLVKPADLDEDDPPNMKLILEVCSIQVGSDTYNVPVPLLTNKVDIKEGDELKAQFPLQIGIKKRVHENQK